MGVAEEDEGDGQAGRAGFEPDTMQMVEVPGSDFRPRSQSVYDGFADAEDGETRL